VLSADKSCSHVVNQVMAGLVSAGEVEYSSDTSAYSQARGRLPEAALGQLVRSSGAQLEQQISPQALWQGHPVKLLDGSGISMCDTSANQEAYPQVSSQKAGCGFPIAKIVVLFSLLSGAVLGVMVDSSNTAELVMARALYKLLCPNDIVLGDRLYGTYVDLVLVQAQGAHGVFRCHQSRKCEFEQGKALGKEDHLVVWHKPSKRPKGMSQEEFAALPATLLVRQLRYQGVEPGFRTQTVILVTTLLDAQRYSKAKLAELYNLRWQAEVNLKHLKTTLKMDFLRCKSPAMVRKDLYVHLLAYNLLRALMLQSSQQNGIEPLQLSVQSARQLLLSFIPQLIHADVLQRQDRYQLILILLWEQRLPQRPHRSEPRVVKRRPKSYPRMTRPRSSYRSDQTQAAT